MKIVEVLRQVFFYEAIKNIDANRKEALTYIKCKGFSYSDFKPVEGQINESDFYEIGYNEKKQIQEVIRHQNADVPASYKLIIHDRPDYRILLYQNKVGNSAQYGFTPTAFIMLKRQDNLARNFMINFRPQFGKDPYNPGLSTAKFLVGKFEDISALMILDDELYPTSLYKFKDNYLVSVSDIFYKQASRMVDYELISIHLNSSDHPNIKINRNTCLEEINSNIGLGDLILPVHPAVSEDTSNLPLWIYSGAHQYKK